MDWLTKRVSVLDTYLTLFAAETSSLPGPFRFWWETETVPVMMRFQYRPTILARARASGLVVRETPDGFLLSRPLPAAPTS